MAKLVSCGIKDEFDKIEQQVEQLGELVYKTGGTATIKWDCYQDFVGILLINGYTVNIKMAEAETYAIEYWKED